MRFNCEIKYPRFDTDAKDPLTYIRLRTVACLTVGMIALASSRGQNNAASAFLGPEASAYGNRIGSVENPHGSNNWSDFGYADFGDPAQRNEAILDIIDEVRRKGPVRLFVESDISAALDECGENDQSCVDNAAGAANKDLAEELQSGGDSRETKVIWDYSDVVEYGAGVPWLNIQVKSTRGVYRIVNSSATGIERDRIAKPFEYSLQDVAGHLKIPNAQRLGATGEGTTVVVFGTPIDIEHQMLRGHIGRWGICVSTPNTEGVSYCPGNSSFIVGGPEVSADLSGPFNPGAHETGTASIVAVSSPRSIILPVQVASPTADGLGIYMGDVAKAMQELLKLKKTSKLDAPLAAANISFGTGLFGPGNCNDIFPVESQIFKDLINNGIVLSIASGNDGKTDRISFPACLQSGIEPKSDGIIVVGSTTLSGQFSSFTNWSRQATLLAPGEGYVVAYPGNRLSSMNGTSGSAPWVAGEASLLKSLSPSITPQQIEAMFVLTGEPVKDQRANAKDGYDGEGVLPDIKRAVFEWIDGLGELQQIYIPLCLDR